MELRRRRKKTLVIQGIKIFCFWLRCTVRTTAIVSSFLIKINTGRWRWRRSGSGKEGGGIIYEHNDELFSFLLHWHRKTKRKDIFKGNFILRFYGVCLKFYESLLKTEHFFLKSLSEIFCFSGTDCDRFFYIPGPW